MMKILIMKFLFIIVFAGVGFKSFEQTSTITKVTKFKPPIVTSYLGINTNGATVTKEDASEIISLPIKVTDDKKNSYNIISYGFLYKRKGVVEDEETGKKEITFTNASGNFKTSPLPEIWITNIKDGFQKDEQLYFFDIVVKDGKGREFFAPDLKLNIK